MIEKIYSDLKNKFYHQFLKGFAVILIFDFFIVIAILLKKYIGIDITNAIFWIIMLFV